MIEVKKDILKNIYKERTEEEVKKYDYGLLIVIGGSDFYSGSPALSSLAAFRAGADMVRIIAPKRAADIIASFSPILAAYPLEGKWLEKNHLATLVGMTEAAKVSAKGKVSVVIGGGIGRSDETQDVILEYLEQINVPVVIDADAIHAISKKPEVIKGKNFLITPNTYEFFVLTKREIYKLPIDEKIKAIQEESGKIGATILQKGGIDIISNGKELAISQGGSPYMTKGGMGDTLAGVCGALLARGVNVFEAACAASYINKKAGEAAVKKLRDGVTAKDLIEKIPEVLY
ncbi:MAG: NAD(P)H-hydrate dehydratase [Candidatus Pacebacteria bacterium]|nr:NAD(P)H-hydrate dehydratase [Candidatus Paceibacterota bacterium]